MEGPGREPAIEELIDGVRSGDRDAVDKLFTIVYGELRTVAQRIRRRRPNETLETTGLLHEAYIRLASSRRLGLVDRAHFTYIAARAMRQVLTRMARYRSARKRAPGPLVTFDDALHAAPLSSERFLALEQALAELESADPRKAAVVECRFFGGLDIDETAAALGVSPATVKRDWRFARAWLASNLDR